MKKKILASIFSLTLALASLFPSLASANSDILPDDINRVSGKDRIYTAIEISKENFDDANYVILATSENFPDALISTSLAKSLDAQSF